MAISENLPIKFSDITQELWGTSSTNGKTLIGTNYDVNAFAKANPNAFHPSYKGNMDRLTNFRGYPYQPTCSFTATLVKTSSNPDSNLFIAKFDTRGGGQEDSNRNTLTLPIGPLSTLNRTYNITIDWGDGTTTTNPVITANSLGYSHAYTNPGVYIVKISGVVDSWSYLNSGFGDPDYLETSQLIEILNWGNFKLNSGAFYRCYYLTLNNVLGTINFNQDLNHAFYYCNSLSSINGGNLWDTSNVKDMGGMFSSARSFNQPIGNWDTSNVESMGGMFFYASSFNQDISNWNTSQVVNMAHMFFNANSFNQPIGNWNTGNVDSMLNMFFGATSFNQPLNNWDTSKVTDMSGMFFNASSFNQPLNSWNVSNVNNMSFMFSYASSFNQNINSWDTSKVTSMRGLFNYASSFNQPLNSWNISNVKDISFAFAGDIYLDSSKKIGNMKFDQPLNNWNTGNVLYMDGVFKNNTEFNQDIGGWNTSKVRSMEDMLTNTLSFNYSLANWDFSSIENNNRYNLMNINSQLAWYNGYYHLDSLYQRLSQFSNITNKTMNNSGTQCASTTYRDLLISRGCILKDSLSGYN